MKKPSERKTFVVVKCSGGGLCIWESLKAAKEFHPNIRRFARVQLKWEPIKRKRALRGGR